MAAPRIKKGMSTFVGCAVGEARVGVHSGSVEWLAYRQLEVSGLLMVATSGFPIDEKNRRVWFALTEKGKKHVSRVEAYYAAW